MVSSGDIIHTLLAVSDGTSVKKPRTLDFLITDFS